MYKQGIKLGLLVINYCFLIYCVFRGSNPGDLNANILMSLTGSFITTYVFLKLWKVYAKYTEAWIRISITCVFSFVVTFLTAMLSTLIFYLFSESWSDIIHLFIASIGVGVVVGAASVVYWLSMAIVDFILLSIAFRFTKSI